MNSKNKLYFGDNLRIMRKYISEESIDLIYLDPPFNSKASYNILFDEKNGTHSRAQITVFDDTWHWGLESEQAYHEIVTQGPKKLADLIQALRSFLGQNDMMAYIVMMAIRLVEMYKLLKPTGSIYLHCDPTASHYLKLVMDAVFGNKNFRNEIIWHYRRWTGAANYFLRMHDVIFFYTKKNNYKYNILYTEYTDKSLARKQHYHTRIKGDDVYVTNINKNGVKENDVWIIPVINSQAKERLGYPTQKPEALLERIIKASSNEGDIVLDPFCGCGTTIAVAEKMKRKWIGIDITHLAITLMKHRLNTAFGKDLSPYEVVGDPKDLQSARALAKESKHDGRYQFEWWALGKVSARPAQNMKKGADSGVDGYIYFFDDNSEKAKKIIVQVKSGGVKRGDIATLKGDMEREKAKIGVFITLEEPTRPMKEEAVSAGFYEPEYIGDKKYPKVQILTIEEILEEKKINYPRVMIEATFKDAKRIIDKGEQGKLI